MKISLLLLFMFIIIQLAATGQVNEQKNYLYLKSDSVIYGKNISYKARSIGSSYFLIDSVKIKPDKVKFYKTNAGFYGIADNSTLDPVFAIRIIKSKINIYTTDTLNSAFRHYDASDLITYEGLADKYHFYNKGFGDVKKIKYRNLQYDLSDNPESVLHLNKCRSIRGISTALYVTGCAAIIGGLVSVYTKTENKQSNWLKPDFTFNIIAIGFGASSCLTGLVVSSSQKKHIEKAIEAYNK